MRKHHKRWVALLGAAAIASSGLVGLPGAVAADEKDMRTLTWPEISQGVSSYGLDGYEIGYLPAELERHGVHASTTTDRLGNTQSQLSWMRGPDQLLGRVSILRSDSFQQLDDLRERRYGHLPERTLERLDSGEALRSEAYLSPETGDLFWLDEPGVAVSLYLQPDKWGSGELVRMAESLTRKEEPPGEGTEEPSPEEPAAGEPAQEEQAPEEPAAGEPAQEGAGGEAGAAEENGGSAEESGGAPGGESGTGTAQEEPAAEGGSAQEPAGAPGGGESSADGVADGTPAGTSPVGRPETPATPEAPGSSETSQTPETPSEQDGEATQEQPAAEEGAQDAPADAGGASGSERPEAARVRMAKECVVSRFVSSGTGGTRLGEMTPASAEFVERATTAGRLGDGDLDRLLATFWYYGDEGVKTGAVEHCADDVELSRTELEEIIFGLGGIIAELVEEAEKHDAAHEENVARTVEEVNAALPVEVDPTVALEPIGAQEWAELTDSLPWSFPTGTS
ncbi:hypothetical protein CQJ94_04825 [Glycomyces fuscus]|nr:hypothetical protein CQJ94_04825 [Glycomyces fuscus]